MVDYLAARGVVIQEVACQWHLGPPLREVHTLRSPRQLLITKGFERLNRDAQQVLEVASVAGDMFAAATVVKGRRPGGRGRSLSVTLGQHDFLEYAGLDEWPDGTVSVLLFHHTLYRQVLAERLGALQRMQVHRRMGERLEQSYGPQTLTIAT